MVTDRAILSVVEAEPEPAGPQGSRSILGLTDTGGAERFLERHGQDIRYCYPTKQWFIFDGHRWVSDNTGTICRLAKQVSDIVYDEAMAAEDPDEARALFKFSEGRCQSVAGQKAFIALAQSEVPFLPEQMDRDPLVLNVLNGTIDLRTGQLRPHDRNNLITKISPVQHDPDADCPLWEKFLHKIFGGNENLLHYVQRVVGYALTGDTREKCLFILHGLGDNGKSTFLNAIEALMGSYATRTPAETFLAKRFGQILNDIAGLRGARFVGAVEVECGRRLAEALIKEITGGDTISARFLRREFFNYKPTLKLFIAANHKPEIRGRDHGIWSRIHLIPFDVQIPAAEQDKQLGDKFYNELPGILNWAIRGCLEWQAQGLNPPPEVVSATQGYREEQDPLGDFISARCVLAPGSEAMAFRLFGNWPRNCPKRKRISSASKMTMPGASWKSG